MRSWISFLAAAALFPAAGCFPANVRLDDLPDGASVEVVLDANARVVHSGRRLKFYLDIVNRTPATVDLNDLEVRLSASPADEPDRTALSRTWTFRWAYPIALAPGKKATLPIVPEVEGYIAGSTIPGQGTRRFRLYVSEFALDQLVAGRYAVRATVNEKYTSGPCFLEVRRPPGTIHALHSASAPDPGGPESPLETRRLAR